ncbi:MAG: hypothetical protein QXP31_01340 [Pyrobaculum sp.]
MDYSIEHARVKEQVEKAQCAAQNPQDLANCIVEQIKALGYAPSKVHLLDANVDPVERPEQTRFIRIEASRAGDKNIHIFTFAVLRPGGVYKALWLQSAVVEK